MRERFLALPRLSQEHPHTCVAACVRMLLACYGRDVSEDAVASLLGTDESGTRFRDIANIARLGLDVRLQTGSIADLRVHTDRGDPSIARVKTTHLSGYPLPPWVPYAVVV